MSESKRAAAAAETGAASSNAMLWPALPNCENVSVVRRFAVRPRPSDRRWTARRALADGPPRLSGVISVATEGPREIGPLGDRRARSGAARRSARPLRSAPSSRDLRNDGTSSRGARTRRPPGPSGEQRARHHHHHCVRTPVPWTTFRRFSRRAPRAPLSSAADDD